MAEYMQVIFKTKENLDGIITIQYSTIRQFPDIISISIWSCYKPGSSYLSKHLNFLGRPPYLFFYYLFFFPLSLFILELQLDHFLSKYILIIVTFQNYLQQTFFLHSPFSGPLYFSAFTPIFLHMPQNSHFKSLNFVSSHFSQWL